MKELDQKSRAAPAIPLEEIEKVVGRNRFVYRLLLQPSPRNTYFLQIATGEDERRTALVGDDLFVAVTLFSLLVRNGVSPCHLEDVLEDFEASEELLPQKLPFFC